MDWVELVIERGWGWWKKGDVAVVGRVNGGGKGVGLK